MSTEAPRPETSAHERSEYDRFEDFARKLVSVPKAEIDKAREAKPA